ncbi:MAG: glycerate kinase [Ignavibacteria bacterium]|nr:glycerate kinase [Ignavibacteria bacterium]
MKYLIAPNSFKECASSVELANLMEQLIHQKDTEATIFVHPVSDGGDGFLDVCRRNLPLVIEHFTIPDCLGDSSISVPVGFYPQSGIAYIESADVFGLKTISTVKRAIMKSSSFGLGILLRQVFEKYKGMRIQKVVLGLGGSAINDYGMGLFSALGGCALDSDNMPIDCVPSSLQFVESLLIQDIFPLPIEVVLDVQANLLGPCGTARVFAGQKGADDDQVEVLEAIACKLVSLSKRDCNIDFLPKKIGASGGVCLGMELSSKVTYTSSREFILDSLGMEPAISNCDVLITGEGRLDSQSFMEKAVAIIIERGIQHKKRIFLLCGMVDAELKTSLNEKCTIIELCEFFNSIEDSIQNYRSGIRQAIDRTFLYL